MNIALTPLAASGTNYTPVVVLLATLVPLCAMVTVIVYSYLALLRHRADAVAMASYRKLAEESVANMAEMRTEVMRLAERVDVVVKLMRDVG